MTRFVLTKAFTDEDGYYHPVGSTGEVIIIERSGDAALVEFDGYEKEKQQAEEFKAKYGEAVNIVAWVASVPLDYLST